MIRFEAKDRIPIFSLFNNLKEIMASFQLQISKSLKTHENFFKFSEEHDFFVADVQKGTFKHSKLKR